MDPTLSGGASCEDSETQSCTNATNLLCVPHKAVSVCAALYYNTSPIKPGLNSPSAIRQSQSFHPEKAFSAQLTLVTNPSWDTLIVSIASLAKGRRMISLLPGVFCITEPRLRVGPWSSVLLRVDSTGLCSALADGLGAGKARFGQSSHASWPATFHGSNSSDGRAPLEESTSQEAYNLHDRVSMDPVASWNGTWMDFSPHAGQENLRGQLELEGEVWL